MVIFRSDLFKCLLDYGADINFKYDDVDFITWINWQLDDFKDDGNKIAIQEITKMVGMLNSLPKNKVTQ